jgi:adenine-specific DNA-methyltransferase
MEETQRRLGQFFTPPDLVQRMLALKQNNGRVLEPSCGNGAFSDLIPKARRCAIELDTRQCPPYARNQDFFAYPLENKFATVMGECWSLPAETVPFRI